MKKFLFFFITILFVFAACSKKEVVEQQKEPQDIFQEFAGGSQNNSDEGNAEQQSLLEESSSGNENSNSILSVEDAIEKLCGTYSYFSGNERTWQSGDLVLEYLGDLKFCISGKSFPSSKNEFSLDEILSMAKGSSVLCDILEVGPNTSEVSLYFSNGMLVVQSHDYGVIFHDVEAEEFESFDKITETILKKIK